MKYLLAEINYEMKMKPYGFIHFYWRGLLCLGKDICYVGFWKSYKNCTGI